MIQANELRIGNLIEYKSKSISINGIPGHQGIFYSANELHDYGERMAYLKDCKPIPLSEEILLKVGFEKITHFTVMNSLVYKLGRNRQLSIGCVGTPNEILFITEVDDEEKPTKVSDLISIHNFDYDGKLYLHKLQNIVAIFGQELNTSGL